MAIKAHALALSAYVVIFDDTEAAVLEQLAHEMGRTVRDVVSLVVERGLLEYVDKPKLRSKPHDVEG